MYQLSVVVGDEYTPWGRVELNLYPDGACILRHLIFGQETSYQTQMPPDEVKQITEALLTVNQTELENSFSGALPDEALYEFALVGKVTQPSVILTVFQKQTETTEPFLWIMPKLKTLVNSVFNGKVVF